MKVFSHTPKTYNEVQYFNARREHAFMLRCEGLALKQIGERLGIKGPRVSEMLEREARDLRRACRHMQLRVVGPDLLAPLRKEDAKRQREERKRQRALQRRWREEDDRRREESLKRLELRTAERIKINQRYLFSNHPYWADQK